VTSRAIQALPLEYLHSTDVSPHSHVVQFYTRDSTLMTSLTTFVATALRAGDAAVVVATDAHRRELRARLKAARLNVPQANSQHRLQMLDAHETLESIMVDGEPDRDSFFAAMAPIFGTARSAARTRFRNTAAFGEMVSLLAKEKRFEDALRLERLWNDFARTTRMVLHCAYPVHAFAAPYCEDAYLRICREHTNVVPA